MFRHQHTRVGVEKMTKAPRDRDEHHVADRAKVRAPLVALKVPALPPQPTQAKRM